MTTPSTSAKSELDALVKSPILQETPRLCARCRESPAVFASEVVKGIKGYIGNYCLLSYEGNPSDVQSYLNIMSQVCYY